MVRFTQADLTVLVDVLVRALFLGMTTFKLNDRQALRCRTTDNQDGFIMAAVAENGLSSQVIMVLFHPRIPACTAFCSLRLGPHGDAP